MQDSNDELNELEQAAEDALGIKIQREMSFGGEGEGLTDVLDRADEDSHRRGYHDDEPAAGCPLCEGDA